MVLTGRRRLDRRDGPFSGVQPFPRAGAYLALMLADSWRLKQVAVLRCNRAWAQGMRREWRTVGGSRDSAFSVADRFCVCRF